MWISSNLYALGYYMESSIVVRVSIVFSLFRTDAVQ